METISKKPFVSKSNKFRVGHFLGAIILNTLFIRPTSNKRPPFPLQKNSWRAQEDQKEWWLLFSTGLQSVTSLSESLLECWDFSQVSIAMWYYNSALHWYNFPGQLIEWIRYLGGYSYCNFFFHVVRSIIDILFNKNNRKNVFT